MIVESWQEFFRLLFIGSIVGVSMQRLLVKHIPQRRTAKLMVELEKITHSEAHLHEVLKATCDHFPEQQFDWQIDKTIATVKQIRQQKTAPPSGAVKRPKSGR